MGAKSKTKTVIVYLIVNVSFNNIHWFNLLSHVICLLPHWEVMVWVYSLQQAVKLKQKWKQEIHLKVHLIAIKELCVFWLPFCQSMSVLLNKITSRYCAFKRRITDIWLSKYFTETCYSCQCSLVDKLCNCKPVSKKTKYIFGFPFCKSFLLCGSQTNWWQHKKNVSQPSYDVH